jgi:hypothetical protein
MAQSRGEPYVHTPAGEEQPHTHLEIRAPGVIHPTRLESVRALLDTGSHWSFVPAWVAKDCQLPPDGSQEVGGLHGGQRPYPACRADLTIFGDRVENVRVLLIQADMALIGRDVLARFVLTFDGPAKRWNVA